MNTPSTSESQNAQVRKRLHEWLRTALPSGRGDELAYHLADLHTAFLNTARRLETLAETGATSPPAELRRLLSGLAGEIHEHIPAHLDGARLDLEPWIERLYEEAEARGEL